MKIKTRDIKKHYRRVERELKDLCIDLSSDSWYDLWHTHLDWDGITDVSERHRKIHFEYYLKMLEKIEDITKGSNRDFQTWILLDGQEGYYDLIYFHTQNPQSEFPYKLIGAEWDVEVPKMLAGRIDLSKYRIGRFLNKGEVKYSYVIQKRGLGLDI